MGPFLIFVFLALPIAFFHVKKDRFFSKVHPYNGEPDRSHWKIAYRFYIAVIGSLIAIAYIIYDSNSPLYIIPILSSLLYLNYVYVKKEFSSPPEEPFIAYDVDWENEELKKDLSFLHYKKLRHSKILKSNRFVFTEHYVYFGKNKRKSIHVNFKDHLTFSDARVYRSFIILSYRFALVKIQDIYIPIPDKEKREFTLKKIEENLKKN